jgi:hypothetical protein
VGVAVFVGVAVAVLVAGIAIVLVLAAVIVLGFSVVMVVLLLRFEELTFSGCAGHGGGRSRAVKRPYMRRS